MIETKGAQAAKSSVPEFTLKSADYSYDVPPSTVSTTDPYTGKTTTNTIPGYHIESELLASSEASIHI